MTVANAALVLMTSPRLRNRCGVPKGQASGADTRELRLFLLLLKGTSFDSPSAPPVREFRISCGVGPGSCFYGAAYLMPWQGKHPSLFPCLKSGACVGALEQTRRVPVMSSALRSRTTVLSPEPLAGTERALYLESKAASRVPALISPPLALSHPLDFESYS